MRKQRLARTLITVMAVVVVTILTAHAQYENALIVVILTAVACWVGLGLVFGIEKKDRTWW